MIKQECIGIPDMILLLMNFFVSKKIKIKAEIVLSPGGAYFFEKNKSHSNGFVLNQFISDVDEPFFRGNCGEII